MDQTQQQQQQQAMQTPIQLEMTLGQVNAVLQAMQKAPYEMAKPMIDLITEQAQACVTQMNAQRQSAPASIWLLASSCTKSKLLSERVSTSFFLRVGLILSPMITTGPSVSIATTRDFPFNIVFIKSNLKL